jgi:hypothetical protein
MLTDEDLGGWEDFEVREKEEGEIKCKRGCVFAAQSRQFC